MRSTVENLGISFMNTMDGNQKWMICPICTSLVDRCTVAVEAPAPSDVPRLLAGLGWRLGPTAMAALIGRGYVD